MRKTNLARLLARHVDGIFLSDFEQSEIGPDEGSRARKRAGHGTFSQVYFFLPSMARAPLQTVLTAAGSLLVAFS